MNLKVYGILMYSLFQLVIVDGSKRLIRMVGNNEKNGKEILQRIGIVNVSSTNYIKY